MLVFSTLPTIWTLFNTDSIFATLFPEELTVVASLLADVDSIYFLLLPSCRTVADAFLVFFEPDVLVIFAITLRRADVYSFTSFVTFPSIRALADTGSVFATFFPPELTVIADMDANKDVI